MSTLDPIVTFELADADKPAKLCAAMNILIDLYQRATGRTVTALSYRQTPDSGAMSVYVHLEGETKAEAPPAGY